MQDYLNTLFLCLVPIFLNAQSDTIPIQTTISGNNMTATVSSDGSIFFDKETGEGSFFHKDFPDVPFINSMDIWVGGLDAGQNLRTAIQRSGEDEPSDFKPGLIEPISQEVADFNFLAKVTGEDIYYHLEDFRNNHSIDNPIESIFSWPARGNPFFEEYTGLKLPDNGSAGLAPFYDENGDNIYNPMDGDYPGQYWGNLDIIQYPNETIWTTAQDTRPLNPSSPNPNPIKVNIQPTIFTVHCSNNDFINNTIFMRYKITNRALEDIDSIYFGIHVDANLGCPNDDYFGVSSEGNAVFLYNSDNFDEDCLPKNGLGENPPVLLMTLIRGPLDEWHNEVPVKHVMPIYREAPEPGASFPQIPLQYYNYLSGSWADGTPLTFGGAGKNGTEITDIIFPDNPNDSLGWSERVLNNAPGKRAFLVSFGSFKLQPNAVNELILAFTLVDLPHLDQELTFDKIYREGFYPNFDFLYSSSPSTICNQILNVPAPPPTPPTPRWYVYPTLASEIIKLWFSKDDLPKTIWAYDSVGRLIFSTGHIEQFMTIPISDWPAGVYFLDAVFENERVREKVIVQHY